MHVMHAIGAHMALFYIGFCKESQAKQWNDAAVRKRYASKSDTIQEVVRSSLSIVTQKGVQPLRCDASATCENLKASSR